MRTGPASAARPVVRLAALLALAIVAPEVPCGEPAPPFPARRLSPSDHDAVRPALSVDGTRIAYVRLQAPEPPPDGRSAGEEIWILETASGAARRVVGPADLSKAGLVAAKYSLLDLAWSPAGDRLAFTWFDGGGWGQVAFADPNGEVLPLPAPVMADRWEGGVLYDLSASQFLWDADGRSGTFVAWDEDCGSLYRAAVPPAGSWPGLPVRSVGGGGNAGAVNLPATPQPLPVPQGCRPFLLGTAGFWLYAEFEESFSQRLVVADDRGSELEEITFPQGRPVRVRWGPPKALEGILAEVAPAPPARSRPPVAGWWHDADRRERTLFTWARGGMREWRREPCPADCADAVAMTERLLFALEGPPREARLVALSAPLGTPREVLPAPVEDLIAAPDGRSLLAVRVEAGRRSIWILEPR